VTYPFVAAPDNWSRGSTPIRAIVIHMAEGGGTVSWLTRDDGNSSHYVVEYTGRIVQMVREDRAAGSINPTELRKSDDLPFVFEGESIVYGYTAAKKALGTYWSNPNAAVIAIETEGFALDGPNAKQRAALASLVADIRTRHNVPALGHRDFQSYKRCPGKLVPWGDYGGHGITIEDNMAQLPITDTTPKLVGRTGPTELYDLDGLTIVGRLDDLTERLSPYGAGPILTEPAYKVGESTFRAVFAGSATNRKVVLVKPGYIHDVPAPVAPAPPADDGITQANVDAAYTAGVTDGVASEQARIDGKLHELLGI